MVVNVGLWEKQQHLISFMEENNSRVKRKFRLTGEVKKVCHRVQANTGL